jgi:hypothetical protein
MKAKLHKMESGYILSLNGDIDDPYAIVNKKLAEDYGWYKLSKQNCDEIFGIIDVEKLADELYNGHAMAVDWQLEKSGFKTGFNKAMELNKDKLFTEDDVNLAFVLGKNNDELRINKLINSRLQPTEIEVEILCLHTGDPEYTTNTGLPKLDEDGCLILKGLENLK